MIVLRLFTIAILLFNMSIMMDDMSDFWGMFVFATLVIGVLLCMVMILAYLYQASKRATGLQLYPDSLCINSRTMRAEDIKVILTEGYFKPVIGILPQGRKLTPVDMVFRFSEDEDNGIADLKEWAQRNQVKMVNKTIKTWI